MPKISLDTGALASVTLIRLVIARSSIYTVIEAVSITCIWWRQCELQTTRAREIKVTPEHDSEELYRLGSFRIGSGD